MAATAITLLGGVLVLGAGVPGGRPGFGVVGGALSGFGLAALLALWGVRPLDNLSFFGLPALAITVGLVLAKRKPFGSDAS
jgi:hypothetical protein